MQIATSGSPEPDPYLSRTGAIPFSLEPSGLPKISKRILLEGRVQAMTRTADGPQGQRQQATDSAASLTTLAVLVDSPSELDWSSVARVPRLLIQINSKSAVDDARETISIGETSAQGWRHNASTEAKIGPWEWRITVPDVEIGGERYSVIASGFGIQESLVQHLEVVPLDPYVQGRSEWLDGIRASEA